MAQANLNGSKPDKRNRINLRINLLIALFYGSCQIEVHQTINPPKLCESTVSD
jgi:hypothetical protein